MKMEEVHKYMKRVDSWMKIYPGESLYKKYGERGRCMWRLGVVLARLRLL